jgi:hypothetical protein
MIMRLCQPTSSVGRVAVPAPRVRHCRIASPARAYVEPAETRDWHKLPVKHVVEAQQFGVESLNVRLAPAVL